MRGNAFETEKRCGFDSRAHRNNKLVVQCENAEKTWKIWLDSRPASLTIGGKNVLL